MTNVQLHNPSLLRRTVIEVANLSDEELTAVLSLVQRLKEERPQKTAAEIRRVARQRAVALRDVPREQLAAEFRELMEQVRAQVIADGTAIDGDWEGD